VWGVMLMLEKLLLASILTFSFSLFTDISWNASSAKLAKSSSINPQIFILTQRDKDKNIEAVDNRP
jgi:hypothetical protein